jgi:hypothetical protein
MTSSVAALCARGSGRCVLLRNKPVGRRVCGVFFLSRPEDEEERRGCPAVASSIAAKKQKRARLSDHRGRAAVVLSLGVFFWAFWVIFCVFNGRFR